MPERAGEDLLRTPGGQLLVDKGDEEDWVPLHSAASCGHVEVAASLLAAGWGRCKLHPGLKAAPWYFPKSSNLMRIKLCS